MIDHTPKDELVTIRVGKAFDVVGTRLRVAAVESDRLVRTDTYEGDVTQSTDRTGESDDSRCRGILAFRIWKVLECSKYELPSTRPWQSPSNPGRQRVTTKCSCGSGDNAAQGTPESGKTLRRDSRISRLLNDGLRAGLELPAFLVDRQVKAEAEEIFFQRRYRSMLRIRLDERIGMEIRNHRLGVREKIRNTDNLEDPGEVVLIDIQHNLGTRDELVPRRAIKTAGKNAPCAGAAELVEDLKAILPRHAIKKNINILLGVLGSSAGSEHSQWGA